MAGLNRSVAWLSAWAFRELCLRDYASSWDWEADYRLCVALEDDRLIELADALLDSNAPSAVRIVVHNHGGLERIRVMRLRGLQELVKLGIAETFWSGLGPGGRTDFGLNRVKVYSLKESFK